MLLIGETARRSGVSDKLIRYYEGIGVLARSRRHENGYRLYDERHVCELQFIKRARSLGFSMKEIRELLGLWRNRRRSSSQVRIIAQRHKARLEDRTREYQTIVHVLDHLISACSGDERPDCPILDDLAQQ
jgi:Cu(I)-responsive transcriptional regulator